MSERLAVVFLVDVDNTLLDNDHIQNDLQRACAHLHSQGGGSGRCRATLPGGALRGLIQTLDSASGSALQMTSRTTTNEDESKLRGFPVIHFP